MRSLPMAAVVLFGAMAAQADEVGWATRRSATCWLSRVSSGCEPLGLEEQRLTVFTFGVPDWSRNRAPWRPTAA